MSDLGGNRRDGRGADRGCSRHRGCCRKVAGGSSKVRLQASIPPRLCGMEGRRTSVRVMPDLVDAIRQDRCSSRGVAAARARSERPPTRLRGAERGTCGTYRRRPRSTPAIQSTSVVALTLITREHQGAVIEFVASNPGATAVQAPALHVGVLLAHVCSAALVFASDGRWERRSRRVQGLRGRGLD